MYLIKTPGIPRDPSTHFHVFWARERSFDISGYGAASGINKALPTFTMTNLLIKRGVFFLTLRLVMGNRTGITIPTKLSLFP